jgi:hypothetical protein
LAGTKFPTFPETALLRGPSPERLWLVDYRLSLFVYRSWILPPKAYRREWFEGWQDFFPRRAGRCVAKSSVAAANERFMPVNAVFRGFRWVRGSTLGASICNHRVLLRMDAVPGEQPSLTGACVRPIEHPTVFLLLGIAT